MELPSKILDKIAFNTRPENEEHMLIVMNKTNHGEHVSIPLQTNNKQFKIGITFLTGQNGTFNVPNSNNKLHIAESITAKDGFIRILILQGAYELWKIKWWN